MIKNISLKSLSSNGILLIVIFFIITLPVIIISILRYIDTKELVNVFNFIVAFVLLSYSFVEVLGRSVKIENQYLIFKRYFLFSIKIQINKIVEYQITNKMSLSKKRAHRTLIIKCKKKSYEINITSILSNNELMILEKMLKEIIKENNLLITE